MTTTDVDYILGNLLPDWPKTPPDPAGNYYASQLKKIHDFSKEVLPQSRHGDEKSRRVRWTSRYKSDYIPLLETKEAEGAERRSAPAPLSREESKNKMFMSWKIPGHLTGEEQGTANRSASVLSRSFDGVKPASSRGIPTPGSALDLRREKTMFPAIGRQSATQIPKREDEERPKSLTARDPIWSPANVTKSADGMPQLAPTTPSVTRQQLVGASATLKQAPSKARATREVLKGYNKKDLQEKAKQFMPNANEDERQLVARVFRMLGKGNEDSTAETTKSITNWLSRASPRERKVALTFFKGVAGSQLLGEGTENQREHVFKVLKALERGQPVGVTLRGERNVEKDSKLRYVRLLTPHTRANREMHTTWHHLKSYRDGDPTQNISSHFTIPHQLVPKQFKIHPDWG